ncbi:MAG: glycogen synthase GlgA [Pseudomonadota bacterium]
MSHKILFVTSEVLPLIKTGGLGDVSSSLPIALTELGHDVRIIMPAYKQVLDKLERRKAGDSGRERRKEKRAGHIASRPYKAKIIARFAWNKVQINLLEMRLPDTQIKLYLIDNPHLYERPGTPYQDEMGNDWNDNAWRFKLLCQIAADISTSKLDIQWCPDVLHANDWPSALSCALLEQRQSKMNKRPATVFTIHNLAHRGLFSEQCFNDLSLDPSFWSLHELEFHGQFSFMKAGLVFSDRINTVSPSYAKEIQGIENGFGLDDLLRHKKDKLSGILNGIDTEQWNPKTDPMIKQRYSIKSLYLKKKNKLALLEHFNLPQLLDDNSKPVILLGLVARLTDQKGIDLLLNALPYMVTQPVQLVILGSGDHWLEAQLQNWTDRHPDKIALFTGYDEELSHQIEAGSDAFLMPSHFEPCGLNQLYSLRYGTLPIVNNVGGLSDTVNHANEENIANKTATGIKFDYSAGETLNQAINQALDLYQQDKLWKQLMQTAMQQEFTWQQSAKEYVKLYDLAIADHKQDLQTKLSG